VSEIGDSSVGIVTRYGLNEPSSIPGRIKSTERVWGPSSLLCNDCPGLQGLSLALKRQGA
jgi:hypothetical protein